MNYECTCIWYTAMQIGLVYTHHSTPVVNPSSYQIIKLLIKIFPCALVNRNASLYYNSSPKNSQLIIIGWLSLLQSFIRLSNLGTLSLIKWLCDAIFQNKVKFGFQKCLSNFQIWVSKFQKLAILSEILRKALLSFKSGLISWLCELLLKNCAAIFQN